MSLFFLSQQHWVPGSGYTFPHVWHDIGIDAGMLTQLDFLKTAQQQYQSAQGGLLGPFIPAFYWDRYDATAYGPANTWGWNWNDPNSQWGGYQYRALQSVATAAWKTAAADAVTICQNFLTWLNSHWVSATQFPPTDFPETLHIWQPNSLYQFGAYNAAIDITRPSVANGFVYKPINTGLSGGTEPQWPTTLYQTVSDGAIVWECSGYQYGAAYGNYHEPHMVALFMRAAIYCRLAGISTGVADALIARSYAYLASSYQSSGEMAGSWSINGDWWLFWHTEIVGTLSILLTDGAAIISNLGLSSALIKSWLDGSITFIHQQTRT